MAATQRATRKQDQLFNCWISLNVKLMDAAEYNNYFYYTFILFFMTKYFDKKYWDTLGWSEIRKMINDKENVKW